MEIRNDLTAYYASLGEFVWRVATILSHMTYDAYTMVPSSCIKFTHLGQGNHSRARSCNIRVGPTTKSKTNSK